MSAPDPAALCAAWSRHYFSAADDAVREYACQCLVSALEDGGSLAEQAEVLDDFLPASSTPHALAEGLAELEQALQQPLEQCFSWLQPPATHGAAGEAAAADVGGSRDQQEQPGTAARHGGGGGGSLRIAAAEFRPAPPAPPAAGLADVLASGLAGVQLDSRDADDAAGWGADSSSYNNWDAGAYAPGDDWGAAGEPQLSGPAARAALLAVLAEQFPLFSDAALAQLFEEQGGSLSATVHTLCTLEAELEGHAAAGEAQAAPGPQVPAGPAFTADDFPSLGGAPASSKSASSAAGPNYARTARAAASLPAPQPSRPSAVSSGGAGQRRGAAPAPIWQQDGGVRQYETGAAVAQEYAQLRGGARDLARLRNAYFQQATQAYLAGNKALARELGAKGREAGERMHAAHAAAADQLFQRRNAPLVSGSSGGGGGVQTVDLHGLHVAEALARLESLIEQLQARGARRLRVVVGLGQHGNVPARLPAAVRRWLRERGLQYSEPYAGLLEVQL